MMYGERVFPPIDNTFVKVEQGNVLKTRLEQRQEKVIFFFIGKFYAF